MIPCEICETPVSAAEAAVCRIACKTVICADCRRAAYQPWPCAAEERMREWARKQHEPQTL